MVYPPYVLHLINNIRKINSHFDNKQTTLIHSSFILLSING